MRDHDEERSRILTKSLREENVALSNTCCELKDRNSSLAKELISSKGMPPFIKRERNRASVLKMIGEAILFVLNVIMYRT